jgi:flavin reductase (DIM6/NTAB) family NADH-FMN oxidoreductase RutF
MYQMFYSTKANDHGLPFNPIKAIVAPRPVGWISSVNKAGAVNLAPYSFFNLLVASPPIVMFSSEGWKDTVAFVSETREFVCNLATYDLRSEMNQTSFAAEAGQSEFELAGLETAPSIFVRPPRVKRSPTALECKLIEIQQIKRADGSKLDAWQVIGEVVGVHINDAYISNGRFDMLAARPVARCGYLDFIAAEQAFAIPRPEGGGDPTGG